MRIRRLATLRRSLSLLLAVVLAVLAAGCQRSPAAAASLRDEYRALLYRDRKFGELRPTVLGRVKLGKNIEERVRIATEEGHEAVVRVIRPEAEGRYPAVVTQHFLGGTKDDEMMSFLMHALAARGYVVAAIDGRYRGERAKEKDLADAIVAALASGKERPWLIDTVFDILRTIDYLQARADVDPQRIGMTGISEGGILTWMAAAADERVRVAVPVIGVTRFQYVVEQAATPLGQEYLGPFEKALKQLARQMGEAEVNQRVIRAGWEKLLPGFMDRFDAVHLVPLIAPRPLLILNHEKDEIIPVRGAEEVYAAARKRYAELDAEDRLQLRVAPGIKHAALDFAEAALLFDWFDRWLKPGIESGRK